MTTTGQRVLTPTPRRAALRGAFWVAAALFAVLVAVVAFAVSGTNSAGAPLDASNPAPAGSKALAEVLRQQGVTVVETSTLDATREAIDDPAATTIFVYDGDGYLSPEQLDDAVGLAGTVVIADAGLDDLMVIAPELSPAGYVNEQLDADCDVTAVRNAGTVSGEGSGYRVIDDTAAPVTCLGSGDGVYSLLQVEREGSTVTILGATSALSNEFIPADGNAALALGLLGQQPTLIWYLPGLGDVPAAAPTIGDLSPAWVIPVLSLLVLTVIAAAVWRGRRFGPLVIENLPVTVRANETMMGRARLYGRSSSRLRALDALRLGAIQRLAVLCGLPRAATVDEVVTAVASLTGRQLGDIRTLLLDATPASDRDLIALSDALLALERDVTAASRP
jgi:hypothetical protein